MTVPRSPLRLTLWCLAAVSGLVTLVLLIATLALPGWLTGRGVQLASEGLGRTVHVDAVQVQPWRLALVMQGLTVAGRGEGQPPLFTLERLDAALSLRSLLRGRLVVESVQLDRPSLRLARTAPGRYDIDDLLQRFAAKPGEAEPQEPQFAVYNIALRDGQVAFDDRPVQRRHELAGLHLTLPFLSTLPADVQVQVRPSLRGVLDGVAFDSQAEALPFGDVSRGRLLLKLAGLDLAPLAAYLPESLPARLKAGRLDLDLALDFVEAAKQAPTVKLSGDVQLHDLAVTQPDGAPWFGATRLRVPLVDVQPLRRQVALGSIVLDAPSLMWRPMPAAAEAAAPSTAAPWQGRIAGLTVQAGRVVWRDLSLDDIEIQSGAATWPLKGITPVQASLRLDDARLSARARVSAERLEAEATVRDLALARLAPLLPLPGGARLSATLSSEFGVTLANPLMPGAADRTQLTLAALHITDARLALPGAPSLARLAGLQVDKASLDGAARLVTLGQVTLSGPRVELARDADGRLNADPLLPPPPDAHPAATAPWQVRLAGLAVDGGALRWRDLAVPASMRAIAVAVEPVKLRLGPLAWPGKSAVPVQLSAQLAPLGADERPVVASAGTLQWSGRATGAPLALSGAVQARALPLHVFNAYLDPAWGLQLQRAELGARADVELRQEASGAWAGKLDGDLRVGPLALLQARVIDGQRVIGEDLLSWQSLQLEGVQLALAPDAPPRMAVREAQLDDAYARLIINEQGRLNLRDIRPADAARAASAPEGAASLPAPEISAERIRLNRGIVDFSDRFVRPNYSARLSELQGSLGAFSTGSPAMAPLTLRGKVAGTGLLEIDGQLKPGAPLALDVAANATDIELAPLSPYAAKYAGYAIERGKLSTRLRYQVQPGGELQASNQIILNQLTFGEQVDSPDATSLPVRFAVALLKDRDGIIDVNLPVSGSLSDPQFSVGGLVWKLFLNLIGKALTAPFSLFGGSERPEEAQVFFQPGGAELAAVDQLDRVARLLIERPGLQLALTGWAGIAAESQTLREQQLDRALRAENAPTPEAALKRLYQAARLPSKPRNALGLVKDLPPEQMRGLLLGSYKVDDEALRQLAVARAAAVRDALLARGAPNARVFLAAPKVCDQACDETWRPHVELSLGVH
ncbi:MAG: DUF748 domain-containing protein [Burkholderiales bacterium]|nr:MAG: DUF748 domain-containing protein [Burkholderiales bacterium]